MNLRDSRVQRIYFCYGWNHNQSFFLVFFPCVRWGGWGKRVVFWLFTKGCPTHASNRFFFFFKLMKICNIDSYYLLRQMVNIFPILVFLHVTAKNHNNKTKKPTGESFPKTGGQKGLMLL